MGSKTKHAGTHRRFLSFGQFSDALIRAKLVRAVHAIIRNSLGSTSIEFRQIPYNRGVVQVVHRTAVIQSKFCVWEKAIVWNILVS